MPPRSSRSHRLGDYCDIHGPISMSHDLLILSVNINRQPNALTTILETTDANILLIQKPSWGRLVPKKSNTDPEGLKVKGTVSHPRWRMILPIISKSDPPPHITIFLHSNLTDRLIYSILPNMNSYSCLGIHLDTDSPLFIINYYHHIIDKRPNLRHLLTLPIPHKPLLLCGDFNTHSPFWSPLEITTSPWAHTLEMWLETHDMMSLVLEGTITL